MIFFGVTIDSLFCIFFFHLWSNDSCGYAASPWWWEVEGWWLAMFLPPVVGRVQQPAAQLVTAAAAAGELPLPATRSQALNVTISNMWPKLNPPTSEIRSTFAGFIIAVSNGPFALFYKTRKKSH